MIVFARCVCALSLAAICVACADLPVSLTENADAYHNVVDELPTLESDMGRIYFFGSNSAFFKSKPTLSVNGEELDGPYGKDIFFFVDRAAGEYVIAVDGEAALHFDLGRGEKKYVAMDSGKPVNPEDGFFEPESLGWIMTIRLMPARHAEAVMRNMRWKK
jgi:hypothetical protein